MAGMLAVRFRADVIAMVRRFARQDGVTVSQWIRKLVEKEMASPDRYPPVDLRAYPRTETVASGGHVKVEWSMPCGPGSTVSLA